jgi:protein-L-isoaspartate(D-aspartate) O-methyltransferase
VSIPFLRSLSRSRLQDSMIDQQIVSRGVHDPLVLDAMRRVPRAAFVPRQFKRSAYDDNPLPIGDHQTISQPFVVAYMIEALELKGGERVLEIGCGSGYAAAVISRIASEVYTVERISRLAMEAEHRLRELEYNNVHVIYGDGTRGCAEHAPFDAIIVAAAGPVIPASLKSQMAIGGRLVMPLQVDATHQQLIRVERIEESRFESECIGDVSFVPLIGEEGWHEEDQPSPALQT